MFYTNMQHLSQSRTIKPRYERSQATKQAVVLDPAWDTATADIFPGSVLAYNGLGQVTLCTGTDMVPAGLCMNWIAPVYGIDEVTGSPSGNDIAMLVMGNDAIHVVEAPAFDTTADWTAAAAQIEAGKTVYCVANAQGKLSLSATPTTNDGKAVCRFLGLQDDKHIVIAGL